MELQKGDQVITVLGMKAEVKFVGPGTYKNEKGEGFVEENQAIVKYKDPVPEAGNKRIEILSRKCNLTKIN